jgi:hypothetical protein
VSPEGAEVVLGTSGTECYLDISKLQSCGHWLLEEWRRKVEVVETWEINIRKFDLSLIVTLLWWRGHNRKARTPVGFELDVSL